MQTNLQCGRYSLDLTKPVVMGILNVTPDSFSDGGRHYHIDDALRQAEKMHQQGAAIIDIGGESTRPGAPAVSLDEELQRVIPVIEKLIANVDVAISIDTSKAGIMEAAVKAGAGMVNDVMALTAAGALDAAAAMSEDIAFCLMHMQGTPRTMQANPEYLDVVEEVSDFLYARADACISAGINSQQIVLDPGFGFGKSLEHNLQLLSHMHRLVNSGYPVLTGISRKSMIASLLDNAPVEERVYGSVAAAVVAYQQGSVIIRVHDVRATVDALKIIDALRSYQ